MLKFEYLHISHLLSPQLLPNKAPVWQHKPVDSIGSAPAKSKAGSAANLGMSAEQCLP